MKKILFSLILFLGIANFLFFPSNSYALTVGPAKLEYSVNPGDTIDGQMFLMNELSETKTFYPSFEKFIEDNGEKVFLKEESDLASWVKTENAVTLKAGEQKNIPFKIEVPKNAPPGGHFAVIWWSTAPPAGGNMPVSIITRAGILVLLRVSGDIKEDAQLLDFSTDNGKKFFSSFPVNFLAVFKNNSNVYVKPQGEIIIKNIFGGTKAIIKVNPADLQILPDSKRTFDSAWKDEKFALGLYKAEINLTYGESRKTVSSSFWFWVVLWKPLFALIAALIFIFLIIPAGIKKYNKWIVNKYGKS